MRRPLLMLAAAGLILTGLPIAGSAKATPAPRAELISQSSQSLQQSELSLLRKYRINLAYQTAFTKADTVWVYDKTGTPAVAASLKAAMGYWNDVLGSPVIQTGTASNHTVTLTWTRQTRKSESGLAWWSPKTKTLKVNKTVYQNELSDITRYMKRHYNADTTKTESKAEAYAQINDSAAMTARNVEYARILTHEFGHVLGLLHSTNRADLMYTGLGFGDIYDLEKVSQDSVWDNPLTKTDSARGQLAYRFAQIES